MQKRIYIAGGGGMLGEAFYHCFREEFEVRVTDIDLNEPWIQYLDFRDYDAYLKDVQVFKPDYLFHLGAYTDLEYCEANPQDTYNTNTLAVENAVHISNLLNIPILYISTAGIFDGNKSVYDDWDTPNPTGHYARSKYMGERFIVENKQHYFVCRAGWMMGGGPKKDKKFIGKLLKQIHQGKQVLDIVDDKFGTPTYTYDFAHTVKKLLETNLWGVYNVACEGETSRIDIAQELVRLLNKENSIRINAVPSSFFQNEYFAPRPASERMINTKLNLRGLNAMRNWKGCLREYLEKFY